MDLSVDSDVVMSSEKSYDSVPQKDSSRLPIGDKVRDVFQSLLTVGDNLLDGLELARKKKPMNEEEVSMQDNDWRSTVSIDWLTMNKTDKQR